MFETIFIPSLVVVSTALVSLVIFTTTSSSEFMAFIAYVGLSVLSYFMTNSMIPQIGLLTIKAEIFGYDINKQGTPAGKIKIPESIGIVPATLYLAFNILGILFTRHYMPNLVLAHTSALLSVTFIILLGFADDVLDLAWRYKLVLPPIASLPVVVAYTGVTSIVLPHILRPYLGTTLDIGPIYYVYMILLATFQSNAINIYAGVNGLEVGQSLIMALSIALHNSIELILDPGQQNHLFSLMMILPYLFTALALFRHNHYPSKVFVGDVFCYWSGITFAVAAILGHFSKTLMLLSIPQLINFLYSVPQLLNIIPCPRHRLPRYDQEKGLLYGIKTNLNLINLYLLVRGPMSEKELCRQLLIFQIFCSGAGLTFRYLGSHLLF